MESQRHPWNDRGQNEKRCGDCHVTAVRIPRAVGGYSVFYFAPDGTQLGDQPVCGSLDAAPVARGGREELFYVFLAPGTTSPEQAAAVEGELASVGQDAALQGWLVHRDPAFVSVRFRATSMAAAQALARPLVTRAFTSAGVPVPRWTDIVAIPAGEQAPAAVAALPQHEPAAASKQPELLGLEAS